ncbi:low temperature requirement protein A [Fodinicola acaciae]|uniref:low temperature requirement protein A n=1 Tax=Fodinicola acaciae TaxID=2681555 RepID=UPI0013D36236|nr:low temperature requirement protein A [Fodinicola acaciae]
MSEQARRRGWYVPMVARRTDEEHRASTPLELFFDLCVVVAVAAAAGGLHHALAEGHVIDGLLRYGGVFFAIWWAWMNFTWFASAYDTDDAIYRVTAFVQIGGALVIAAGVGQVFEHADWRVMVVGYVIMRLAGVTQWLRAAYSDPERRRCTLRYAGGIAFAQVCWIAYVLFCPPALVVPAFLVAAAIELAVPVFAERAAPTTWHPEHIGERYGLLTLIVLGESVLAASNAVQAAVGSGQSLSGLVGLAVAGLVVVFGMWWLYFEQSEHQSLGGDSLAPSIFWGYGHLVVFSSAAAVGGGLELAVGELRHEAHLPAFGVGLAITVPVALYLLSVWVLMIGPARGDLVAVAFPAAAVLVLAGSFTPVPVVVAAVVVALLVVVRVLARREA